MRFATRCLLVLLWPGFALAHGFLHERMLEADAEIARSPTADAFYRRAELKRLHGDVDPALSDYAEAARRDPGRRDVELGRARLYESAKLWTQALVHAEAFLATSPSHGSARATKARALAGLGRHADAAAAFTVAITNYDQPDPDLYVERARAFALDGEAGRALASLEEGRQRLGPAVSLTMESIRIATHAGRHDDALQLIDGQIAGNPRPELWLERKMEVLLAAGRRDDAEKAGRAALDAVAGLPDRLREGAATRALLARVQEKLDGMKRGSNQP